MKTLLNKAKNLQKQMSKDRRWLHAHAEVGFDTNATKKYIATRLTEMGISWQEIGKGGIVAVLAPRKKGGATLLRADIDALHIEEKSGEPFACEKGRMHACGHDLHAAILLGAAQILKDEENNLPTPVKLLFQPAEELLQGAEDCVQSGLLENPKVVRAAALHVAVATPLPTGTVVIPSVGVCAPAADFFKITVQGKGCHGSAPQNGVDALLIAAHILLSSQEIITREIPSSIPTVLTFGKMQGGDTGNAIAEKSVLEGTLRSFDEQVRAQVKSRLEEIANGIAKTFQGEAKTQFFGGCPCLVNEETQCARLAKCTGQVFDERFIFNINAQKNSELQRKSGGSEDFAFISQKVPSVFFSVAAGATQDGFTEPLHSPRVRFDEEALYHGAAALAAFALCEE